MGEIRIPRRVKLFSGVLCSDPVMMPEVEARLADLFGMIDLRSESFPFDSTVYYDEEMGKPLRRYFFGFAALVRPEEITAVKIRTNRLEADFASRQTRVRRPVNIDPGYLEEAKIVLASTKNFSHRILVADGIYAEVTMRFEHGAWSMLPWTFPDFRTGRYNEFFTALRDLYRIRLKTEKCGQ
jgi:hypothetical protein